MKLAIFHYHLNRGGVTRVIENHLRSLDVVLPETEPWPVAVLHGGRHQGWPKGLASQLGSIRLQLVKVPFLEYDSRRANSRSTASDLAGQIATALDRLGFTPDETVLHVHNHTLGKSVALPGAVRMLAERGFAMVLQPHDFAEDFRPANFRRLARRLARDDSDAWHGWLYPQASHIHYTLLNSRDHEILGRAGVEATNLHLLPNPVPSMNNLPAKEEARAKLARRFGVAPTDRLILYPVRGIRRKNQGEALLHAALAPPGTVIGLTLAPMNPVDRPVYDQWKELVEALRLPVCFELGAPDGLSFIENLAASDAILTTSLAEGFGMVFLESWLAGRPLIGRNLSEITSDFMRIGLRLDSLYPRADVPVDWIGAPRLGHAVCEVYPATLAAYGRNRTLVSDEAVTAKTADGLVDFGELDEPLQQEVLKRLVENEADRRRLLDINPTLAQGLQTPNSDTAARIHHNVNTIEEHFSVTPSGQRLLALYRQAAASDRQIPLQPLGQAEAILDAFLDLKRFRLIRS